MSLASPVHLMDIHLEKGMHCIDCHFVQDVHGNNRIQDEVRAGCEIQCIDCHGTVSKRATLRTSGVASYTSSPEGGRNLEAMRTPSGKRRFEARKATRSSRIRWWRTTSAGKSFRRPTRWTRPTGTSITTPSRPSPRRCVFEANGKLAWGDLPKEGEKKCAHANENMSCIACHSSWNASCFRLSSTAEGQPEDARPTQRRRRSKERHFV